jgi:FMN-dependent NADH-azoreductase
MNKMIPHIIALSCSPSRGRNSDSMLDAFIDGVRTHDNISIEKIYLEDVAIDTYKFTNSTGPQEHEVEFQKLTEKIKSAQGLIIATPTYNFSVPAHLKNFIDRLRFFALDMNNTNRMGQPVGGLSYLKTYFLVSGGTPKWAQRILFFAFPPFWLRAVFLYYASQCYGAYYSGDTATHQNKEILAFCTKLGKRYGKKVLCNTQHSILEKLFWRPPQKD